jgi:hypothetical protein
VKAPCYKDVTLSLPPYPNGIWGILGMEVNICSVKGLQKWLALHLYPGFEIPSDNVGPRSKIFILSEVEDLVFDLIMLMIIFVLDGNSFESKIKRPEDLSWVRVQAPHRSLQMCFKQCMLHILIARSSRPFG